MKLPIFFVAFLPLVVPSTSASAADDKVDFNRDVRPILSENCFQCHGPDAAKRLAKLRLDTREGAIASVIVPGQPDKSEFVHRLTTKKADDRMPPEASGKTLTPAQIATLTRWVAEGAEYKGHWAFLALKQPSLPKSADEKWVRTPIDRFISSRLEKEGMKPSPDADPITLIRRLSFDLTGLPPTIAEVDEFLKAWAAKPQTAYESLVDRLLASPRYGERMALDWLDAARFADTHGYHIDSGRNMTHWREYVIDSFNKNKRFDEFTVEQIAGDLLPNSTMEQRIASGFNRNHMINFEGGAIPEEYQTAYIVDRVNTTATVWMGLSVGCAQCHDHKFDPITMKDYYQLYAFFNNVPERGLDGNRGNAMPFLKVPTKEQERKLKELRGEIARLEAKLASPSKDIDAAPAEWQKSPFPNANKTEWKIPTLGKLRVKGGATLKALDDKSYRAEGTNPATENYTVSFTSDLPRITAIRIEALADAAFPEKGPGRSANGNFVMTGVRVTLDEGKTKIIGIKSASADFSQKEFPVANLAGKGGGGWAIHPEVGKDHWAVIELAEPIAAPGKEITVQLQFNSQFSQHQFGRFRVAVTDSVTPHRPQGTPPKIEAILKIPSDKRTESQKGELRQYYRVNISPEIRKLAAEIASNQKLLADIEKETPDAMVMEEMPKPRDTFMLVRGQYDKKGEKVMAGTPASLPALGSKGPVNRLDLAKWLVRDDHPLMARVIVNRYWQMYFGTGLVKTSDDFGTQGEFPTHPELLDWLAAEFRDTGWNVKKMQKLIVMSAVYRQSSQMRNAEFGIRNEIQLPLSFAIGTLSSIPHSALRIPHLEDPENRLFARMSRLRLQAEFIRDQALAVSGLLNGEIGGASVSPYQPKGIWEELASRADGDKWTAQKYVQSTGKDLYRRTMYTFWKRTAPPPSLTTLDAPDRETCTVRRSRTNTPLQALVLMNDPTYVEASRKLAERILVEGGATSEERLTFGFRLCTARKPNDREAAILKRIFEMQLEKFRNDKNAAEKLLRVGDSPWNEKLDPSQVAAWALVASTILNLDEVLTKN